MNSTEQISKIEISNGTMIHEFNYERELADISGLFDFFQSESWSGKWNIKIDTRHLDYIMPVILFSGNAIYLTLFTIWATINAYHLRRLHIGWIIAFTLLNVIGYLLFVLVRKRKIIAK